MRGASSYPDYISDSPALLGRGFVKTLTLHKAKRDPAQGMQPECTTVLSDTNKEFHFRIPTGDVYRLCIKCFAVARLYARSLSAAECLRKHGPYGAEYEYGT